MKAPRASIARLVWMLVLATIACTLVATLWFVARTIFVRIPYWGEAEVLFEASRVRRHLPLYVDPLIGATEYGEPASRFYVTYPPVWTWVVSVIPEPVATIGSRIACTLAWVGALAGLAWTARPDSRNAAATAAAFVAGIWVLANFATVGRPDSIACAIAAVALARAMRHGRVDLVGVVLLVAVPWVKPTLIGLPVGCILGACLVDRRSGIRTLACALVLVGATALFAHVATAGALFRHVIRSNAQPLSFSVWLDQVGGRLPFFAPLFAWAAWVGWKARACASARIGLAALGFAVSWTLFALAKTGSSSNYWMEPAIASVALVSRSPSGPVRVGGDNVLHALGALAAVVWADVASIRGAIEHSIDMRAEAEFVASVRARAGLDGDAVIAADAAGIELVLNQRILTPTYQMVHLVRRNSYPAELWIGGLTSPRTCAFVEHTGQLRLVPRLQRVLEDNYDVILEERGFRLWKRRQMQPIVEHASCNWKARLRSRK